MLRLKRTDVAARIRSVDSPMAALIRDFKQRGMPDDKKLTCYHAGHFKQLSQFGGQVIKELIA